MHTFTSHVKQVATKARKKAKILAGSYWDQDQETMTNTYKAATLEYGSPILAPVIKPSLWESLQSVQIQLSGSRLVPTTWLLWTTYTGKPKFCRLENTAT